MLGFGSICTRWKEAETQLEGNVYWGLWWDTNRSEETDGGDGETCESLQRSISSKKLCQVNDLYFVNHLISLKNFLLTIKQRPKETFRTSWFR